MHSNTIGTLIMNATNMQVIENIAEHLWEVTYSGNEYLYIAKTTQITH